MLGARVGIDAPDLDDTADEKGERLGMLDEDTTGDCDADAVDAGEAESLKDPVVVNDVAVEADGVAEPTADTEDSADADSDTVTRAVLEAAALADSDAVDAMLAAPAGEFEGDGVELLV